MCHTKRVTTWANEHNVVRGRMRAERVAHCVCFFVVCKRHCDTHRLAHTCHCQRLHWGGRRRCRGRRDAVGHRRGWHSYHAGSRFCGPHLNSKYICHRSNAKLRLARCCWWWWWWARKAGEKEGRTNCSAATLYHHHYHNVSRADAWCLGKRKFEREFIVRRP